MTTGADYSIQVEGLKELHRALDRIGVPDDAIKDAMQAAGGIMQKEAFRLMPMRTGNMARTLKVNRAKNLLRVSVGNNTTVKYAYTFHAIAMGKSRGGFTFKVPAGKHGKAYKRQARIPNRPFLFQAAQRTQADVFDAYNRAIKALIQKAMP